MMASWSTVHSVRVLRFLLLIAFLGSFSIACAEELENLKALKYHKLLVKRPEPGYLFDRFYNTWLDQSTVDALGTFLKQKADEKSATADQLLLAFFYIKKGDDVAAIQLFDEALADNPASAATWFHKGLVEARTLDFDAAIADLKKARERSPEEKLAVQIDKQLGKLLVRNRETKDALKIWQGLLDSHPNDEELAEDLLELYIDEGLLKEAAALAERLLKQTDDPHLKVMRQLRLGDIHYRSGERDGALEVYTKSLDDVGSETWLEREILAQVDQVLRREDDLNALKSLYDDLGKKYPKRVGIHRRRAQLMLELGDNEAGLAAFREVLKLTPGHRPTREEYVTVLTKAGKPDVALQELRALCEQNPKDAELRFRLVGLLQELKKTDEVAAATDEYLATSDGSEYAHLRAARALEKMEEKDAAERIYRTMAEKFADSPSAQEAFAAFLYSQGEKEDALNRWKQLAAKADVTQVLHVGRTLAARNEHQAALDMLQSREAEFANEPLFLGQLVSTAIALKKFDDAIPWALARVKLADEVADLETAIDHAATTIERADKLETIANEQEASTDRLIPETCLLAELWERIGDSHRADEVLKKPADEGNLLAVSEQIRLASQRREWASAAKATKRILTLPGGRKSLYVRRLVELYQRDFQLEEALKWVQEWKRLSPGSTSPWVTESRLLNGLGKIEDALKILRVASAQFDEDEDLKVRLAEMYVESEKYADAERIYWQLYEDNEDLGNKLRWAQELAKLSELQGTTQQIVENFNQRIESNRRSIVPWLSLSEVYRVANDYEGRRRALTSAAKIKPNDLHLLQQIARVAEQDGDWQEAVKTLERAIPLDKTNRTREQIAQLNLRYGDEEVGFSQLMELASENSDPRSLETAADSMCGMQDWERAAKLLQSRIADYPGDYRLRYLMAVALEEAGDTDAALEQYVALLDNQEELTGKKVSAGPQSANQGYYGMMRAIMPSRSAEWIELMQYRHTAYAYRQQAGMAYRVSISPSGGGIRSTIQMPPDVNAVRPLAVAHALMIGAMLDDDGQQELWRVLESHGIEHAAELSSLDPQRGDFTGPLTAILEKDPQNETALAIMVLQGANGQQNTLVDHLSAGFERFRKPYPQLAFMAAVRAGIQAATEAGDVSDEENSQPNKFLDEALEIAETMDSPNTVVVMSITNALSGRLNRNGGPPIGDKYQQKFSELIIKWYPQLTNSPYGQYAYYMVIQTLASNADPTAYVQFLDDEVARFQTGGSRANSRNNSLQMMMSRNRPHALGPPIFPPTQLATFPPTVLAVFSSTSTANPFGEALEPPGGVEDAAAKLGPLLDKVKSPLLRILLAKHAELDEVVDKELKQLLDAKSPNVDSYLLAASLAGEKENFLEVVRLLDKARYLPMSQGLRRQVDEWLMASVIAMKVDAKTVSTELLEIGKQACLRLRRGQLDQRERAELIAAMEELGLKKEAKKLDELASQTAASATMIRGGAGYSGPTASTPQDRIAKLIADGKRDVAVRLLAGELSGHVQQILVNAQNLRSYRYQFRDLRQRIEALGLTKEVLASITSADTKNPRRMLEHAMACQLFDLNDQARKQYEALLASRPKDDAARLQLILLLGNAELAGASEHIKLLGKAARDQMPQLLADQLQDYELTLDERLGFASLMVELLKAFEAGDIPQQSYGFEYCLSSLGRQMHTNRGSGLPSLYGLKSDEKRLSREKPAKELLEKRSRIHEEMCREMLKKPGTARLGFKHLLASTESQGEPTDEFSEQAQKILMDAIEARPGHGTTAGQFYFSTNAREVRFRGPEEFLVERAWKTGDWKLIDETLLPKLDASKTRAEHDQLKDLSSLYRCEEAEFLALAKGFIRRTRPANQVESSPGLTQVVETWRERKLNVDIEPMILAQLKQDVNGQNHHQAPAYLISYLDGVAKTNDGKKQLALLDEVATIYLGPAEKRNDFIRKYQQQNMMQWGSPNGKIYVFGQLMDQLCERSELLFAVLEHLQQYEIQPGNNAEYRLRSALSDAVQGGTRATMRLLSDSPWLGDLDTFKTLNTAATGDRAPLAYVLQVNLNTDDARAKLRKLLADHQGPKPTFGGGFILAFLDQKKDHASLLKYLGEQLSEIEKLPPDRQTDLASMAADMLHADAVRMKDLGESAIAAKAWINKGKVGKAQTVLERVEKAKRLEELGIQHGQIYNFARETLCPLVQTDPSAAAQMFERVCDLSRDAQKQGEWHMYFGDGQSTSGWLLEQASYQMNQPTQTWNSYNFLVDIVKNSKGTHVAIDRAATHIVGNLAYASLNPSVRKSGGKPAPFEQRIRILYEQIGETIGDRPSSLIIGGLYDRGRGMVDEKQCELVRKWARGEVENGTYPSLASDIDTAFALIASEKVKNDNQKQGEETRRQMADYHQHLLKHMRNSDLPIAWRVNLATLIARCEGERLPLEVALEVTGVHAQAMEANAPIVNDQNWHLTRVALSLIPEESASESLKVWREKWAARFLKAAKPSYGQRQFENINDLSHGDAICDGLVMFLSADDEDRTNQLLRKYGDQIANLPRALATLVRGQQIEKAVRFVNQNWPVLSLDWPQDQASYYDAEIAATAHSLYEAIDDAEIRYFTELLLASMPDGASSSDNASEQSSAARDERIKALGEKFDAIDFKNDACHKRVLVLLSRNEATREKVAAQVAQEYKPENLASAFRADDESPRLTHETQLAVSHFGNQFREGQCADYVELLKRLIASSSEDDYQFGYRLVPILESFRSVLGKPTAPLEAKDSATIAAELRNIFKDREYIHFNDSRSFNNLLVAMQSHAGEAELANKWIDTVSENCRHQLANDGVNDDIWKFGLQLNATATPENLAARLNYVENVLRYTLARKWIQWNRQRAYYLERTGDYELFDGIVRARLMSEKELEDHGDELVEKIQDVPTVTAAWAAWLQKRKEFKRAAVLWQAIVDSEIKDKKESNSGTKSDEKDVDGASKISERQTDYVLRLVRSLKESDQENAAAEALALLDGKEIPESMRSEVTKTRQKLNVSAGSTSRKAG